MGNLVEFGSLDPDMAKEELNKLEGRDKPDYFNIKKGKNRLRFLPGKPGKRAFVEMWKHFVPTPSGVKSVPCPRKLNGSPCFVCTEAFRLKDTPGKEEQAKDLYAKRKWLAVVVNRDDEDRGPQVIEVGRMIYDDLMKLAKDPESGGDFTHPMDGYDIVIEKSGQGRYDTNYSVRPARTNTPLHEDVEVMNSWMTDSWDITKLAEPLEEEDMRRYISGEKADATPALEAAPASSSTAQEDVLDAGAFQGDDEIPF